MKGCGRRWYQHSISLDNWNRKHNLHRPTLLAPLIMVPITRLHLSYTPLHFSILESSFFRLSLKQKIVCLSFNELNGENHSSWYVCMYSYGAIVGQVARDGP